jgi:hypothetical protein
MIINEGRTSVKISNEEAQRQLNQFDEFYAEDEPEEPGTGYAVARVALLLLSASIALSGLYWVWGLAHG